jgi:hypothetical protein
MKKIFLLSVFAYCISTASAQFTNVMIDNSFSPEEPSITINPLNVSKLVAGSNNNNNYYSDDGGATWISGFITSTLGETGDPCLISDSSGSTYYFHLSDNYDRVICQRSDDNGITYNNGSFAWNNNQALQDKEWVTVDKSNGNIYLTWTQYDNGFNPGPTDSSNVFFSRSTDNGTTFSNAIRLNDIAGDCLYLDITDGHPFTGPNGEVYMTYMDSTGIRFNKSTDFGNTWMNSQPLISGGGGDYRYYSIPGVSRIRAMPYSACDLSHGIYRGNIYVSWTDQRNGLNNTDLFFIKSTDGGNTWSSPFKVNSDNTITHQFRNAMTVDQATGNIYIVYYDRRNYSGDSTDVYLSKSVDAGNSWTEYKISNSGFANPGNDFDGDYIDIAAHDGVVRPIWTRVDGSVTSIWTCLFNETSAGISNAPADGRFTVNPNPADVVSVISFPNEIRSQKGEILDAEGRIVQQFSVDHQREKVLDVSAITPGIYFIHVGNYTSRLIIQAGD